MATELEPKVWHRLGEIFRMVFDDAKIEIRPEWSSWDLEGWDSLMHLQLILAVENEFGIEFKPQEVLDLKNIGQLFSVILQKLSRT